MQNGDFVLVDFLGKVASTGEVFDFTQESVAKTIRTEKTSFGPALVIVGAQMVLPGVEKHLLNMKVGEEKTFSIPATEAFGPRSPHFVRIFSMTQFIKQNVMPNPGSYLEIDGMRGKVQSVSGGRVRMDFNHPLAGKELSYWVKIQKQITDTQEKTNELFTFYGLKASAVLSETELKVTAEKALPKEARTFVEEGVKKWIPEIKSITFLEIEKK